MKNAIEISQRHGRYIEHVAFNEFEAGRIYHFRKVLYIAPEKIVYRRNFKTGFDAHFRQV